MFTTLPKSDVLPKIFVKITQKIQILLDIFNKSALRIILSACLHAVVCCYKTGRGWVHAVVCGNKTGRETKNALYLNEILHRKPSGFLLVRGRVRVLYKQTFTRRAISVYALTAMLIIPSHRMLFLLKFQVQL